jgi:hypothetical protein
MAKRHCRIQLFSFLLVLLFMVAGCREPYDPPIDKQEGVIVVEGLITNLNEPSFVKISVAQPYNSLVADSTVTDALVILEEDNQVKYLLHETAKGYYVTDPLEFTARPGHSYTLLITTATGEIFRSAPQMLLEPATIDSTHGNIFSKEYIYKDVNGRTTGKMEPGAQTVADFRSNALTAAQFRFKSTLLIGFTYIDNSTSPFPSVVYVWKKINPDKTINITSAENAINTSAVNNYPVSFFPFNEYLYGLKSTEHIENWFLQVRQYTLNNDTYQYYREVDKQLSSTGALFDPIASQISGNIKCISNPGLLALGFFEVSGCSKKSVFIKPQVSYNIVDYSSSYDLDTIPDSGVSVQEAPFFWRY